MTSLKILAAAMLVAVSAPAFASEGGETTPNKAYQFVQNGGIQSSGVMIEGRNSAQIVDQARAAIVQGFAPVDTAAERGSN
jgi:hypothetical protein